MKRLLTLVMVSLYAITAWGKNYSLKDTNTVDSLIGTAKQIYRTDPKAALKNCHHALYISKKIGSKLLVGRSYNGVGIIHNILGSTDSAIYYFEKAFEYLKDSDDYLYAYGIRLNMSDLYFDNGKVLTAFNYINESMHVFDSTNDAYGRMVSRMNLARVYSKMDMHEEAKGLYYQAININKGKDSSLAIQIYANIAGLHLDEEQYDSAEFYLSKAKILAEAKNHYYDLVNINLNLGDAMQLKGYYGAAKSYYFKGLKLNENFGANFHTAYGNARLCRLYLFTGLFDSAYYHGKIAEKVAQNSGDYVFLEELYYDMHNVMDSLGNEHEAHNYLHMFIDVEDSIKNEKILQQIEKFKYETLLSKKQKSLEALEEENKAANQIVNYQRVLGIIITASLIVFIILVIVLKRQSKEFEKANLELTKTNNVKNQILATMTHDLRAPLSSLFSLVNLSNRDLLNPKQSKEIYVTLEKKLSNTLSIVDNLLYWSKNQIAEIKPEIRTQYIDKLILKNIELYGNIAADKDIKVEHKLSEQTEVSADRILIDLVIRNLLANAIKYTLERGKITITTEVKDKKMLISIKDTGIGMKPEVIEKLFSEEQFSSSGTNNEVGTGLGLIISNEFVKMHGSSLKVKSTVGEGSCFSFELPLA